MDRPGKEEPVDTRTQELFDAALALPEGERARLVERLLETLSPASPDTDEDALDAELRRRQAKVRDGTAGLIAWPDLRSWG
jgi:putative addiction module component (TIGR02574 family)